MRALGEMFAGERFDAVLCNGVLGYGVDSAEDQREALAAVAAVLKDDGALLLGWNTDKIADPLNDAVMGGLFEPAVRWGLPTRLAVPGGAHIYDILRKAA